MSINNLSDASHSIPELDLSQRFTHDDSSTVQSCLDSSKEESVDFQILSTDMAAELEHAYSSSSDEFEENKTHSQTSRYFLEKSGPTCFNCGKVGHMSRECTSISSLPCYLCGVLGHQRSSCPEDICYNCLRPGHMSRDCPIPRRRRLGPDDLCRQCQLPGHISRDCSLYWRRYVFCKQLTRANWEGLPRNLKPFCYNCGGEKHFGDECSQRRKYNYSIFHFPSFDYLNQTMLRLAEPVKSDREVGVPRKDSHKPKSLSKGHQYVSSQSHSAGQSSSAKFNPKHRSFPPKSHYVEPSNHQPVSSKPGSTSRHKASAMPSSKYHGQDGRKHDPTKRPKHHDEELSAPRDDVHHCPKYRGGYRK